MIEWEGNWIIMACSLVLDFLVGILLLSPLAQSMRLSPLRMSSRMATLPTNVVKYSQVPKGKFFTRDTIPKGLLRRHNTKQGTWGVINLAEGKLRYTVDEGPHQGSYNLNSKTPGIIEPQVYHSVAPIENEEVKFVVEFYRLPNTGPVDEQREGL